MSSFLPIDDGILPLFVLLVGVTAITNAIQSYASISYTKRVYPGLSPSSSSRASQITKTVTTTVEETTPPPDRRPSVSSCTHAEIHRSPVTPLASRLWGTWCMAVGIVRVYAAYNIHDKAWYQLSMWTNVVGLTHYFLEAFVYRTSSPSGPWLAPVTVAMAGLLWSIVQYDYYVR